MITADAIAACFARPIAHRGLHACGAPGPMENSIGAAKAAVAAGYGIECDVQLSRDGDAVVFHDERLDRLTKERGLVTNFDAATLEAMALGATHDTIPTLARLLDTVAGQVPLVVEIKRTAPGDLRLAERVMTLIEGYRGAIVLESFDPIVVLHCLRRAPCPVGLVGPADVIEDQDDDAFERCDFVSWSIDRLDDIVRRAPSKPMTSWTIRTQAQRAAARRCQAQIVFEGFDPDRIP